MSNYVVKIICTLENQHYSNGTGFLCSHEGHIVTCAHNIVHCKSYCVYYKNKIYDSILIAVDNRIDIAILKIDESTLCPVLTAILQYGQCYTYGYHHDHVCLSYQSGSIMTLNYVSDYAIDSTLTTIKGFKGASGSPIFNNNHEIIGIFCYESSIGCGGVVLRLLNQYLQKINRSDKYISVQRSHTGIVVRPVSIDDILSNDIKTLKKYVKGEYVIKIIREDIPLCVGDIIVSINTNIVGSGFISSESYVLYMTPNTQIRIEYLCASTGYKREQCFVYTLPYPSMYDKPLKDTTIFKIPHH